MTGDTLTSAVFSHDRLRPRGVLRKGTRLQPRITSLWDFLGASLAGHVTLSHRGLGRLGPGHGAPGPGRPLPAPLVFSCVRPSRDLRSPVQRRLSDSEDQGGFTQALLDTVCIWRKLWLLGGTCLDEGAAGGGHSGDYTYRSRRELRWTRTRAALFRLIEKGLLKFNRGQNLVVNSDTKHGDGGTSNLNLGRQQLSRFGLCCSWSISGTLSMKKMLSRQWGLWIPEREDH